MTRRMAKIQTSSWTCNSGRTARRMKVIKRHAGDAVGLEAVGGGSDAVAGVVAGAVGDHAGVSGVVFLDFEDDLHEVGADVGDLGEYPAGDAQAPPRPAIRPRQIR